MNTLTTTTALLAMLAAPAVAGAATDSWLFGTPQKQNVYGQIGYSGTPRIGYITPLSDKVALGGEFILDIGLFNNLGSGAPGELTIAGAVPIKVRLTENQQLVASLTFHPGIGAYFPSGLDARFNLLLHSAANIGFKINEQLLVGPGVDIPLTFTFGSIGNTNITQVYIPLLFGAGVEYLINPQMAVTGELKMGPHIIAGDLSSTNFGFKFMGGFIYYF